jgi:hypothetical protein
VKRRQFAQAILELLDVVSIDLLDRRRKRAAIGIICLYAAGTWLGTVASCLPLSAWHWKIVNYRGSDNRVKY